MIRINCPHCQDNFIDECYEHALMDDKHQFVDANKFYVCPTCKNVVDISDPKNRSF